MSNAMQISTGIQFSTKYRPWGESTKRNVTFEIETVRAERLSTGTPVILVKLVDAKTGNQEARVHLTPVEFGPLGATAKGLYVSDVVAALAGRL